MMFEQKMTKQGEQNFLYSVIPSREQYILHGITASSSHDHAAHVKPHISSGGDLHDT